MHGLNPYAYTFKHGWPYPVVLRVPIAMAQVQGKSQGRLDGRYLHDPTLCEICLSSCPWGFVFLVTRLIPQKHVTDSSFLTRLKTGFWTVYFQNVWKSMCAHVNKHKLYIRDSWSSVLINLHLSDSLVMEEIIATTNFCLVNVSRIARNN